MTQVKICGLTRPADVRLACALGASYVGFVFAAMSTRRVEIERAGELADAVLPGVARVGVFVDEDPAAIATAVARARLDLVQIHRRLREEDLDAISVPIVTVARVTGAAAAVPEQKLLSRCRAILFDTAGEGARGGTGTRFDWDLVAGRRLPIPLFLAGGLDAENVAEAITRVRPCAVDVSSGVEREPGVKDPVKMERFFEAVRGADAQPT
jgi:phosphoribosylanthranilate isomerase